MARAERLEPKHKAIMQEARCEPAPRRPIRSQSYRASLPVETKSFSGRLAATGTSPASHVTWDHHGGWVPRSALNYPAGDSSFTSQKGEEEPA